MGLSDLQVQTRQEERIRLMAAPRGSKTQAMQEMRENKYSDQEMTTPDHPSVNDVFSYVNDRLDMLNEEINNLRVTLTPALRESYPQDVQGEFSEFKGESDLKNGIAQIGHRVSCALEELRTLRMRVDV